MELEALVEASRTGDRQAFGRIVSAYQGLVCSVAYSFTGDLHRSEDIAQEAFLAACVTSATRANCLRGCVGSPATWRVARSGAVNGIH